MTPEEAAAKHPRRALTDDDARQIINLFTTMDEAQKAELWNVLRGRALKEIDDYTKTRILTNGEPVTNLGDGTRVGFETESYADILNFRGAVAINARENGRQFDISLGAGADCMFDYLVSSCWAAEVAAGRGVEGQTETTRSGCTYKIYSTIQGAATAAATDFPVGAGVTETTNIRVAVIFVCAGPSGQYTETVTATVALNIFGSGADSVTWIPAAGAGNSCIEFTAATGQGRSRITGFAFHPSTSQYGIFITAPGNGFFFDIYGNRFMETTVATAGISVQCAVGSVTGSYAAIHDNVFAGTGQHVTTNRQSHIYNNRFVDGYVTIGGSSCRVTDNHWEDSPSANGAIVISVDPIGCLIARNHFFTGNAGSMAAGIVQTTYASIAADTDISLSIIDNVVHPSSPGTNCEFFNASSITSNSGRALYVIRGNDVDFTSANTSAVLIRAPSATASGNTFWDVQDNAMMMGATDPLPTLFDTYPDEMHLTQSGNVVYGGSTGDTLETGKLALIHKGTTAAGGSTVDVASIWWPAFHFYSGSTLVAVAQGTYEYPGATASGTYYVSVNSSGTVTATGGSFPADELPLATVVFETVANAVTSVVNVVHLLQRASGGGVPASASEPYVTIGNSADLSAERALTMGRNMFGTDGGANGAYTLDSWLEGAVLTPAVGVLTLGTDGDVFHVAAGNFATIGTPTRQTLVLLVFDGVSVLTHGTDLILQGSANFTTAAGDAVLLFWEGGTVWREVNRHMAGKFYLGLFAGIATAPIVIFDESGGAYDGIYYDRPTDTFQFLISNTAAALLKAAGLAVSGFVRVGASSDPTNTTGGDLTATRLIVPNAAILHSAITQLGGPVVIPTGGKILFSDADNSNYVGLRSPAVAPAANLVIHLPSDTPSAGELLKVTAFSTPDITTEWAARTALVVGQVDVTVASASVPYILVGPMPAAGTISAIYAKLGENKTNGATSSIFDVHKIAAADINTDGQGTTIYTTQGNRPTIANTEMGITATAPDVTAFAVGDWFAFYTDQAGTTATVATVSLKVAYT